MSATNLHEPIHRSNQTTEQLKGCLAFFKWLFLLVAIVLLAIMIFKIDDTDSSGLRILCIIVAAIFGVLALFVHWFSKDGEVETHFELNETGIHEYAINHKTRKESEYHLLFEDIDKVLIGNYVNHINFPTGQGVDFNRFGALIILINGAESYFEKAENMDEFNDWVTRLEDKQCPIYFTDYNLAPALRDRSTHYVDFTKIKGVPWSDITEPPPVGQESRRNPFLTWEHEGELKDPGEKERKEVTRKAEKLSVIALFVYALFAGAVILPGLPLDGEGAYETSSTILFGITMVNILIPSVLVYWRNYTKWRLPLQYLVVAIIGNSIALLIISLVTHADFVFWPILVMNVTNLLLGWFPALIAVKMIKVIFEFLTNRSR
ncbi:hypothetical protein GCM10009001_25330 [Virgibacillus siamensis]|uniref:Uncharacterized protein n=1 Tax=Virgibacillus siamensis TaxID=480071 RepID=A0ABP3RG57_9BACI